MSLRDEYPSFDATTLAEMVANKDVTAEELVDVALERLEKFNPQLNAVVYSMSNWARKRSKEPLSGPFAGVPFLLKDLHACLAGHPTTSSTTLLGNYVPKHNSHIVQRHLNAGLIYLGKTNTPEFGIMGTTEPRMRGPSHNPWNLDHTPGGSSGGSAAAVAARIVPMAHGGDGGGSIRIPASACGLFGLKPTRGRNSFAPDKGEGWAGFVQEHAVSISVRDSARLLDATQGGALGDPYEVRPPKKAYAEALKKAPKKLKIAFSTQSLFGLHTDAECVAATHDAAKLCESLGHHVEPADIAIDRVELIKAYLLVVSAGTAMAIETAGVLSGKKPKASDFEPSTWFLGQLGRAQSGLDQVRARDYIHKTSRHVATFFENYDCFLCPTMAQPPQKLGVLTTKPIEEMGLAAIRNMSSRSTLKLILDKMAPRFLERTPNTQLFNQTGQPAMSVPLFWGAEGLPVGVQFAGRFGDEATLFKLAAQLEQARPWKDRLPPLLT